MKYAGTQLYGMDVVLRDMEEADVERIVDYWHENDAGFLQSLGVDPRKFVSKDETKRRLLSSTAQDDSDRTRAYFIVSSGRELIAYTNLNFRSRDEAVAHFHVLKKGIRSKAIAYQLFLDAVKAFFNNFPINVVVMETSPENERINHFLQRFGLTPRKEHIANPDGMARPGEFNVYEIHREDYLRTLAYMNSVEAQKRS